MFGFIEVFKLTGEPYFDEVDAYENYERVRKNLNLYVSGLLEGIALDRDLTDNFYDIFTGLNNSNKSSRRAPDLAKPKPENFNDLDLVERNFRMLFAGATESYISGRNYIDRWQMYNQLFGVDE